MSRALTHQQLPAILSGVECSQCLRQRPWLVSQATAALGSGQRFRRNAVTAVGVRLCEAPDAPSRGEVRFRIPSVQRFTAPRGGGLLSVTPSVGRNSEPARAWLAVRTAHVSNSRPEADRHGSALADPAGGRAVRAPRAESDGSGTASGSQAPHGDLASWKDPL